MLVLSTTFKVSCNESDKYQAIPFVPRSIQNLEEFQWSIYREKRNSVCRLA
jgi:hypothetical protein